jgi:hypothetical protein
MKLSILHITLLCILVSSFAYSDGLPVDPKRKIQVPHSIISINESQKEEMETMNSITLTKDQWEQIRKVSPNTSKRLTGILPITWDDCTCGIPYDGIRMTDGRIAILHKEQRPESIRYMLSPRSKLIIHIDSRGQFYINGVLIRYNILREAIKISDSFNTQPNSPQKGSAIILIPPHCSPKDPAILERATIIYQDLANKGWNEGRVGSLLDR